MDTAKMPESVFECSSRGYTDYLKAFLKMMPHLANMAHKGSLPLIEASFNGHAGAVQVLLEHGALVNAMDKKEQFALLAASLNGHPEVIEVLVSHGAKLDLAGQTNGKPALNAASKKGELQSVKTLLAHGANVESEDINGWTPLFVAAKKNHVEVVKYLLQHGANPNLKDMTGKTPLVTASALGCTELVRALLEGGAQVDIQNSEGSTALSMSSLMGFTQIVELLLEHGARVSSDRLSPLAAACFAGHVGIARTLLDRGAKEPKLLAVLIAILMDRREVVELFRESGNRAHPFAERVARTVSRAMLFDLCSRAADNYAALHHALSSMVAASPELYKMEEMVEMQKLVLDSVNDYEFKSMSRRSAGMSGLVLADGERSLTLRVLLHEFMELDLAADWHSIGALLDLPAVALNLIKKQNAKARDCMREMLEAWLKTIDPPPTWEGMVEAVEVLHESKAQYLRKKFCT